MKNLNFRKLAVGLGVGLVLLGAYILNLAEYLDFFLIRWEYILPPIVGVYFLSIQPYLNYADAKTYFISGAKFGLLLALALITANVFYELAVFGELNPNREVVATVLSYFLFTISYMVVAGVGHYLFNKNVDPERKDIWRPRYYSQALLVAGFTFLISVVLVNFRLGSEQRDFYYFFVPVIIASYVVVRLHHVQVRDFIGALSLGAITGFLLSLATVFIIGFTYLLESMLDRNILTNLGADAESVVFLLVIMPILIVSFTFVGAATGMGMKLLRNLV